MPPNRTILIWILSPSSKLQDPTSRLHLGLQGVKLLYAKFPPEFRRGGPGAFLKASEDSLA